MRHDDDAFARFSRPGGRLIFPNAATINRARALLEEPKGVNPTEGEADALARLDDLAAQFAWRMTVPDCAKGRFAIAYGVSSDNPQRLRAIVCRAYAVASAYVTEQAQALQDQEVCGEVRLELERTLDRLAGPISGESRSHLVNLQKGRPPLARALEAVQRFRRLGETVEVRISGTRAIEDAVATFAELLPQLQAIEGSARSSGDPEDMGRFVFAMRLAEMLTFVTTVSVHFDPGQKPTDPTKTPKRKFGRALLGNDWQDFLDASLDVTGLSRAAEGSSGLMRRLREGKGGNDLGSTLKWLAEADVLEWAALPSTGYLIDRAVADPKAWNWPSSADR